MNNYKEKKGFQNKKASDNITYILLPILALIGVIMLFTLNAKKINTGSSILEIFSNNNIKNIKKTKNTEINNKFDLNKKTEKTEENEQTTLTEKEFKEKKIKNKDIVIIDLRTPEEINTGKISKDALEINFYEKDFKDRLNKLDKNKEYFIYCAHGNRSRTAKEIMKNLGFKKVFDLKGGIITWKSELYDNESIKNNSNKKNINEKVVSKSINKKEAKDFKGKVTFIAITSTSCPHCRNEIPNIEKNIYKKYGNKINFYVNVVNGGKWRQNIPQGYNPNLQYKYITGRQCGYVPSWVILNKNGGVVKSVCGGSTKPALSILKKIVK